jgi:5'-nucleotidase
MLTASNGIKVGVIGLAEREWLDTINALPPDIIYKSASETAKELIPGLKEQGAEIIVCVSHQREPNDNKLAKQCGGGLIDIILGGHDHYYSYSLINGTQVLRSGTDFKQLSHIQAWRKPEGKGWDFKIVRRDVVSSIPQDPQAMALVEEQTREITKRLDKPIGYTAAPLDARFTTVRTKESNIGNFVCDLMRYYYSADCCIMAAGTIRGDQIYPPGILKLKDIVNCFPFEDPVVVLKVTGKAIREALENGVSSYPALEGRFPQVSNISFEVDYSRAPHSRVQNVMIGEEPVDETREYILATRGYMGRGKGTYHPSPPLPFTSLLLTSRLTRWLHISPNRRRRRHRQRTRLGRKRRPHLHHPPPILHVAQSNGEVETLGQINEHPVLGDSNKSPEEPWSCFPRSESYLPYPFFLLFQAQK